MNAKKVRVGLGVVVLMATTAAAASGQIATDRPDFTEGTATVPDGRFQIEAGYTYIDEGVVTRHQIGEALLRYGLIPGLELRIGAPSIYSASGGGPLADDESGIGDASLGIKLGLYEAGMAEGLPSVSLLLGSTIPIGDDVFGAAGFEPEAVLALGWEFAPRLELGANVKFAQRAVETLADDEERYSELAASMVLGLPVTSSVGAFIEYYAIRPDKDFGRDQDVVDGGVTFQLSPTLQFDARLGFDIADDSDLMFFGVGLAKLF